MKTWFFLLASCFLLIHCDIIDTGLPADQDEKIKDAIVAGFNSLKGGLEGIPGVEIIVGAVAPLLEFIMTTNNDNESPELKAIKKGFEEISNKLDDSTGRIIMAVESAKMKEVATKASSFKQHVKDIAIANSLSQRNLSIHSFLKLCATNDPYVLVTEMTDEIPKLLRLQLENDVDHSRKRLTELKLKMYGILHELTIATAFQADLLRETKEEKVARVGRLARKMDEISRKTHDVLEELLNADIWVKIEKVVKKTMDDHSKENVKDRALSVWTTLKDVYTSGQFCLMVSTDNRYSGKEYREYGCHNKEAKCTVYDEGKYFHVHVSRSRIAHNMTENDRATLKNYIINFTDEVGYCPQLMEREFEEDAKKNGYSVISIGNNAANTIIRCDRGAVEEMHFACRGSSLGANLYVMPQ